MPEDRKTERPGDALEYYSLDDGGPMISRLFDQHVRSDYYLQIDQPIRKQ